MLIPTGQPNALQGARILSIALNLPGPAALARCQAWGAFCTKLEPPAPSEGQSADPMARYCPEAYSDLHAGIRILHADLKTDAGQHLLHQELAATDVLITSFRPSALRRLGMDWDALHAAYPALSLVRVVGMRGGRAEEPGHDLTYQAAAGLIPPGTDLPSTLYADMAGALLASEAVLRSLLARHATGRGVLEDVALADAAHWLAAPRGWGIALPAGDVGGAHAGYRVYRCADGRVAVAALEPHFLARLYAAAGCHGSPDPRAPATHDAIAAYLDTRTRAELQCLADEKDLPLHPLD
ncbi:CoA transferase [Acidovorax sp. GBBC 3334]|uniref:CoA transferase n=1 Tax=Acidovorax sp. GBBC 3334 TaxID=2940496 RepID=UPI002302E7D8|nr:CoA transferase [Acidovorax sp. GBBC 3334]MDA8453449.1 CoA transferase [Acidovorax sp. GBBC 3334]